MATDEPSRYEPTERTRIRQFAFLGRYEKETIHAILDAALMGFVGFTDEAGDPVVVPTAFWRVGDTLYWHGSAEARMLKRASSGIQVCFTVCHVDGLKLSRVMSRHSFNYRSAMVFGTATALEGSELKRPAMRAFVERLLPGRWDDGVHRPTDTDLARICVVRMEIREASAKTAAGAPNDNPLLVDHVDAWAGHLPIKLAMGRPEPHPALRPGIEVPGYATSLAARFGGLDRTDEAFAMPVFPRRPPPAADAGDAVHRLTVVGFDAPIEARADRTVLASALAAGVPYPFGCASGDCASCRTHLDAGEVDRLPSARAALSDADVAAGWFLACSARPRGDCTVSIGGVDLHDLAATRHGAVLVASTRLTPDVTRLVLRVAERERFRFRPGQFVMLGLPGLPEREYSIASQPGDECVELEVQAIDGGRVSGAVAGGLTPGTRAVLRGPFGVAHLREDDRSPIVAMAGGSGLAPIRSIVERALRIDAARAIALYIGARDEARLYGLDRFEALARRHPALRVVPVLSRPEAATPRRTGRLDRALHDDAPALRAARVHLAGSPAFVASCRAAALALGALDDRIHADAFLTTADKLVRSSDDATRHPEPT